MKLNYLFMFLSVPNTFCLNIQEAITNYILQKNIKFVSTHLSCWCHEDINRMYRLFNNLQVFVSNSISDTVGNHHFNLIDLSCNGQLDYFLNKIATNSFDSLNKWVILTNHLNTSYLHKIHLRLDTDIILLQGSTKNLDVFSLLSKYGQIQMINLNKNAEEYSSFSKYNVRKNLTGYSVRMVVPTNNDRRQSALEYLTDLRNKHVGNENKVNFALMETLREIHGYSIKLIDAHNVHKVNQASLEHKQLFKEDKADVSSTAVFIDHESVRDFDLLMPSYLYRTSFIFYNSGNIAGKNVFLEPMAKEAWYATVGTTIIVIILLRIVFTYDGSMNTKSPEIIKINLEEGKDWSALICDVLSILIQQGSTYEPHCLAGRCILFTYLALGVLVFNYYSSIIVANLLISEPPAFRSIVELKYSGIGIGMQNCLLSILNTSDFRLNDTKYSELSTSEGVDRITFKMFAYYSHEDSVYPLLEKRMELVDLCDLNELKISKPLQMYAFAKKGSEYSELFKISLTRIAEVGALSYIHDKWMARKPACFANRNIQEVTLSTCLPIYIIFISGCILSLIFLFLEKFTNSNFYSRLQDQILITFKSIYLRK